MKRPPALRLSVRLQSWLSLRLCVHLLFVGAVGAVLPGCVAALLLAGSTDISNDGRFALGLGYGADPMLSTVWSWRDGLRCQTRQTGDLNDIFEFMFFL